MPIVGPSMGVRASRTLGRSTSAVSHRISPATATQAPRRLEGANAAKAFSAATARRSEHAEEPYDPPTGWLWGDRPGEKYEKEGWEGIWMWGFFGSMGLATVAYAFKPDTSIQTWALEEARRRLEVEGILKEPEDK